MASRHLAPAPCAALLAKERPTRVLPEVDSGVRSLRRVASSGSCEHNCSPLPVSPRSATAFVDDVIEVPLATSHSRRFPPRRLRRRQRLPSRPPAGPEGGVSETFVDTVTNRRRQTRVSSVARNNTFFLRSHAAQFAATGRMRPRVTPSKAPQKTSRQL